MRDNRSASRLQIDPDRDAIDAMARGLARLLASVCIDDQKTQPTSVDSSTDGRLSVPAGERLVVTNSETAGEGSAA